MTIAYKSSRKVRAKVASNNFKASVSSVCFARAQATTNQGRVYTLAIGARGRDGTDGEDGNVLQQEAIDELRLSSCWQTSDW